ncbi:MAG: NifB/NifX family molybdenum-iron cluster-binding protein [Desulfotalea sp.]
MKIAITAKGKTLDSLVDPRFGRAAYIIILDSDTNELDAIDNSANVNAFKGAGIQAATSVHQKGAEVLMTGYCGPKAFQIIDAAGIKVISETTGTVADAVTLFKSGNFNYTDKANAEAHW